MKDAYYFSHDANARHDPKIQAMRSQYDITGYGMYWIIIEMLREQTGFKLPKKEYIYHAIAMQMQSKSITKDYAKEYITFCINECDLFQENDDFFWSESLVRRMDKKVDISEKRKLAARARWDKVSDDGGSDANAMQMDANAMQDDAIKGKESKEKIIKTSCPKFETSDLELAQLLFDKMLENNPNVKKPNLEKWADTIRKMRTIDKRTVEQIRYLIDWTQRDEFWSTNILSAAKLRDQYDRLVLKIKAEKNKQPEANPMVPTKVFTLED